MKKIFATSLVISLMLSQQVFAFFDPGSGKIFSDVKDPHPYAYQIDWLGDNGVVRGYDDGTFKPEKCVNRAEFLKMMYTMRETDVSAPYPVAMYMFGDVDLKAWYWPYLRYAIKNDIVQGYSDKTFRPGQCVNRVEAVKMAVLEFNDGKVPKPWGMLQPTLSDVAHDAWYSPMMEYAHDALILGTAHVKVTMTGVADGHGKYFPDQSMTRGEVAYLLYMSKALKDNNVAAHDGSIWANGKKEVLYNEERGLLMPKQFSDAYGFDGCGKMDIYAKESWYNAWKSAALAVKIEVTKISDACYSPEKNVLIFMVPQGYAYMSDIYKYDGVKFDKASFTHGDRQWFAGPEEFGKRMGTYISLIGHSGDAGCGSDQYFEYYYGQNIVKLTKESSSCVDPLTDEQGEIKWTRY